MVIDLTADSPSAALQQEVSRLRAENRRLQLELEAAQAGGGAAGLTAAPTLQFRCGGGRPWQCRAAISRLEAAAHHPAQPAAAPLPALWLSTALALLLLPPCSVDRLILLGSPLGCFLALRGVNAARGAPLGSAAAAPLMQLAPGLPFMPDGLPAVNRLLNVYHPYDPVAHRCGWRLSSGACCGTGTAECSRCAALAA